MYPLTVTLYKPIGHWSEKSPDEWHLKFDLRDGIVILPNGFRTPLNLFAKTVGNILVNKDGYDDAVEKYKSAGYSGFFNQGRLPPRHLSYLLFEALDYSIPCTDCPVMMESSVLRIDLYEGYVTYADNFHTSLYSVVGVTTLAIRTWKHDHWPGYPLPIWFANEQHLKSMAQKGELFFYW